MKLYIAEKPSVAKAIIAELGIKEHKSVQHFYQKMREKYKAFHRILCYTVHADEKENFWRLQSEL